MIPCLLNQSPSPEYRHRHPLAAHRAAEMHFRTYVPSLTPPNHQSTGSALKLFHEAAVLVT